MFSIVLFIFNGDIFNDLTITINVRFIGDVINFKLAIVKITVVIVFIFKICFDNQVLNISDVEIIVVDDVILAEISDVMIVDINVVIANVIIIAVIVTDAFKIIILKRMNQILYSFVSNNWHMT